MHIRKTFLSFLGFFSFFILSFTARQLNRDNFETTYQPKVPLRFKLKKTHLYFDLFFLLVCHHSITSYYARACLASQHRLSVKGFCRPASWRTAGTSLDASECISAAAPRRTCAATGRSCCGWWSRGPGNRGLPERVRDCNWGSIDSIN